MARGVEKQLAEISRLRDEPLTDAGVATLRKALGSSSSYLVSRAARLAGELELEQLTTPLCEAFARFLGRPASDKGCLATTAAAEALYLLGADCQDLFLQGIAHRQPEPVYGGTVDAAAGLRGHCAMGLVRIGYPRVTVQLAYLLADPEAEARLAAARAIGYAGLESGVPLLIHKLLSGDADAGVMGECCASLLAISPDESSLELVGRLVGSDDAEVAEAAALALGESRLHEALPILEQAWRRARLTGTGRAVLVAIALLRRDEAITLLLSLVAGEHPRIAADAVAALSIYRYDDRVLERLREAMQERSEPELRRTFAEVFGDDEEG